jgi:phosphoglycerol transferase MdoB-like AlkP superfamily enzyme
MVRELRPPTARVARTLPERPERWRALPPALGFLLLVATLTRVVLLGLHRAPALDGLGACLAALLLGLPRDLLVALWALAPLSLYLALLPERLLRGRWQRRLLLLGAAVAAFGVLFAAVAELFFFLELDSRFNFVAVDYLMYPTEVGTNIWESYPTAAILGGIGLVTLGLVAWLRRRLLAGGPGPAVALRGRLLWVAGHGALLVLATLLAPALPAHLSGDRALDEIADNGWRTFVAALAGSHASYAGLYPTAPLARDLARLRPLLVEPALAPASWVPGSTLRHLRGEGPARRLNVVVVLEESLGAQLVGTLSPAAAGLTPELDRLAARGTLLTRAYSTGNRTIRAIEATTTSLPPLPGISVVRRPQSRHLFTLPELLRERGYETMFVYGGRALFDGMGSFLSANGVSRVIEQGDYPASAFRTAWGVADEHVFDHALVEMDRLHEGGRPFYALLLTTTNHRPFQFPTDHVRWDPRLHRRENAVRYADWALGRFLRQAEGHPFFRDTLFVVMGDHGARVYGAAEVPLASYHVPVVFYAPGMVAAGRRLDTLASSLDVPPTVLGLLGLDYDSRFLGHDVFRVPGTAGRALMTHNSDIALLRGSRLAVLGLRGRQAFYGCDAEDSCRPLPLDAAGRELLADAAAYYDAADQLYRAGLWDARPTAAEQRILLARASRPATVGGGPATAPGG